MSSFGAFAILQTFLTTWTMNELCLPACGHDRYFMVLLAVFSFAGQILLTMALQHEQAGPVAIARSADVVFAFIWQVTACITIFYDFIVLYIKLKNNSKNIQP